MTPTSFRLQGPNTDLDGMALSTRSLDQSRSEDLNQAITILAEMGIVSVTLLPHVAEPSEVIAP